MLEIFLVDNVSFLRKLSNIKLWLYFQIIRMFSKNPFYKFRCNIYGKVSNAPLSKVKDREAASCYHCCSSRRLRSIVAALSKEVFGKIMPIDEFPMSKSVVGIGMSDANIYVKPLAKKLYYKNKILIIIKNRSWT